MQELAGLLSGVAAALGTIVFGLGLLEKLVWRQRFTPYHVRENVSRR